jgi:hypothetical protein
MPNPSSAQLEVTTLRQLRAPEGWCACILEAEYPMESERAQAYRNQVQSLLDASDVFAPPRRQQVLLQFDRLRPGEDVALLRQNARVWLPDIGLGVWPHRDPPRLWSHEEFIDTPMEKLRPIMHRILRVDPDPAATRSAWETMLGLGIIRIASQDLDAFYRRVTDCCLARIDEPSFESFPFYLPLLEARTLAELSPDELLSWLGGADAYTRESSEDGGLLLLLHNWPELYFQKLIESDRRTKLQWEIRRPPRDV